MALTWAVTVDITRLYLFIDCNCNLLSFFVLELHSRLWQSAYSAGSCQNKSWPHLGRGFFYSFRDKNENLTHISSAFYVIFGMKEWICSINSTS